MKFSLKQKTTIETCRIQFTGTITKMKVTKLNHCVITKAMQKFYGNNVTIDKYSEGTIVVKDEFSVEYWDLINGIWMYEWEDRRPF